MEQIRIGIIGCGNIARSHVDGYQKSGAPITAVTDIRPDAAEALARDLPGARVFPDHTSLLDAGVVDAVSICSPPDGHEAAALHALGRGVHVLCEKPLAHTLDAGRRMAAAAAQSRALFMTAFRHRFLPAIRKLKELIDAGRVGEVVLVHNCFCGPAEQLGKLWFGRKAVAGGGTLMDTSSHSVDLFRFLVGEIAGQHAVMHRHLEGTDVEDASILVVRAGTGAVGSLAASWVAGEGVATIDVMGRNGRLVYDYANGAEVRLKVRGAETWETIPVEFSWGFPEEIAHFLRAIRGEEKLACTAQDGLRALEVIQSTYMEE
jgi:predicted dehydrogenase